MLFVENNIAHSVTNKGNGPDSPDIHYHIFTTSTTQLFVKIFQPSRFFVSCTKECRLLILDVSILEY